jgi:hypothetical protein
MHRQTVALIQHRGFEFFFPAGWSSCPEWALEPAMSTPKDVVAADPDAKE